MAYSVRKAVKEDLPVIEKIYAYARDFMASTGNPNQWGSTHPPVDQLREDIHQERLYVVWDGEGIHGVFYFWIGDDPTYDIIYDGTWHRMDSYGTIHRIAGDGSGGVLKAAVEFCGNQIDYLRIDTHSDNHVMQKALKKLNFRPCGTIYISDGTPRIAYDYTVKKKVYFDQSKSDGPTAVFSTEAEYIPAGTMINAMPIRHKQEVLQRFSEALDIHFIFEDRIPWVDFYAVPYLEVIASDSEGGWIGTLGEDAPVVYVDSNRKCWQIAENIPMFSFIMPGWKREMIPYDGLKIYASAEAAKAELEFVKI